MAQVSITTKSIQHLKPSSKPYFLRDSTLRGFGVKVNPSGSISFIAEVKHKGCSHRKTLGHHPVIAVTDARKEALLYIGLVKSESSYRKNDKKSLADLLLEYTGKGRLKQRTVQDYHGAINFYLSDWLRKPVRSITNQMVERRFYKIRDKGISGGIPTYSQAIKTMRILSALMNYARADEIIENNPVDVLKLKRIDRSIRKRENYLPAPKVKSLLELTAQEAHPVALAVHLMLHTGLRKNEVLRLKWSDIEDIEGISCLVIKDIKNGRPLYSYNLRSPESA